MSKLLGDPCIGRDWSYDGFQTQEISIKGFLVIVAQLRWDDNCLSLPKGVQVRFTWASLITGNENLLFSDKKVATCGLQYTLNSICYLLFMVTG